MTKGMVYRVRSTLLTAVLLVPASLAIAEVAGTDFDRVVVDPSGPRAPWAKTYGDIDGDGLTDIIVGGHSIRPSIMQRLLRKLGIEPAGLAGELIWYRNPSWDRNVISTDHAIRTDIEAVDLDADGDQDLVVTTDTGLLWLRNPDWTPSLISELRLHDVEAVDINADGRLDLVARNQSLFGYEDGNRVLLFLQSETGQWHQHTVAAPHGEGLAVEDLDGDGHPDIVVNEVWLKNPGADAREPWHQYRYAGAWTWSDVVVGVADIDGDQRPDIVATPSEPAGERYHISWFRNPRDATEPWTEHVIDPDVEAVYHALAVEDFTGDGRVDVLAAEMNQGEDPDEVRLYVNSGSQGPWQVKNLANDGLHNLRAVDIDGDFDIDFFGTNWQRQGFKGNYDVRLWINQLAAESAWTRIEVDAERPWQSLFVFAADLDHNGTVEIATGGWIYEQQGSPGVWARRPIGAQANNVVAQYDFDGDGDLDFLVSGWQGYGYRPALLDRALHKLGLQEQDPRSKGNQFVWARNDGSGRFQVVGDIPAGSGDFLQGAAVLNDDQRLRVLLSWHREGEPLQAIDVPAALEQSANISDLSATSQSEDLQVADVDRDGDNDVVLGTIWLENHGDGSWSPRIVTPALEKPDRVRLEDMNGDGRLDIVIGFEAVSSPGWIAWYEQPPDLTAAWIEHRVARVVGPMSLDVGDIDGDGDLDLAAGEHNLTNPATARLMWFENLDGNGMLWRGHLIHRGDEHHDGAHLTDIDGDGDLDIVSIGWGHGKVLLYLNPGTVPSGARVTIDP